MFRSYERRLLEPVESLSDLAGSLVASPAMDRPITQAVANQVSAILAEARRAGWSEVEGYDQALKILDRGVQEIADRRDDLLGSWLVGEIIHPAQRLAQEAHRKVLDLAKQAGTRTH